jgi:hypothetical protein
MLRYIKINGAKVKVSDIFDITLEQFTERINASGANVHSDNIENVFAKIKEICTKLSKHK